LAFSASGTELGLFSSGISEALSLAGGFAMYTPASILSFFLLVRLLAASWFCCVTDSTFAELATWLPAGVCWSCILAFS